jgi:RNA polymerase sigma-70 factor (ECF subfamily)
MDSLGYELEPGLLAELRTRPERIAALFDSYRDKLRRMIMLRLDGRLAGKVDAEDVLQDVFLETSRRMQDFFETPAVPLFIWLRQITSQILIDIHRRYLGAQMRDVRQEVPLLRRGACSASSVLSASQLADSLTTPSQCAIRREAHFELRTALARLEERDREVLVLRHLEELSNSEVAELLGIDKYAASKRYVRALERLRSVLRLPA